MDYRIESLRPGESVLTDRVLGKSSAGKIQPDKVWLANRHKYQLYSSLMIGGSRVLCPPPGTLHPVTGEALQDSSYLRRLPGETSVGRDQLDAWRERRKAAAHDPVAARIIWVYVDTLFRQQIDRQAVIDVLGSEILDDVDRQGSAVDDWLPQSYAWGLAEGWAGALVDMPVVEGDEYPSAGHLEAAGIRPYVQLLLPSRFYRLELDDRGRVTLALVHEKQGEWRLWRGSWSVLLDADGHVLEPPREHAFGRPPIEIFRAQDPDPDDGLAPIGESAMSATSLIDLQILQHMSLGDDVQRKTAFPFLHVRRDDTGAADMAGGGTVSLGPDLVYAVDAEVAWMAPPAELSASTRAHIADLESRALKIGGVHRRSQESIEAHSGLALDWENAPIYATVQRWARRLRAWEIRIWRLMAAGLRRSPEDIASITVVYPDDFSTRPIDQDLGQAGELAKIYGGYADAPAFVRAGIDAKVRRALQRDVGHVRGVRELLDGPAVGELPPATETGDADAQPAAVATSAADESMAAVEELKAQLTIIEQLVKAKAPNELIRVLVRRIADRLEAATPEVIAAISTADFRWYTEVQSEIAATGETAEELV